MANNDDTGEIPLMVAVQRTMSNPKFSCILVKKEKKLSAIYEEVAEAESNNNNDEFPTPTIQVATTENGEKIPFNARITIDQASKMLRSDILWVNYQISSTKSAPPTNLRNAFEVLKAAQTTKRSLPVKYPNPINGSFKLFNRLVSLCEESGVFFRYVLVFKLKRIL